MNAVEISNLSKSFGRIQALRDLSFVVPEGSLFGLIGPNGAGKTTAFSVMAGYLRPDSGEVTVRGQALLAGQPPRGRIAMLPQDAELLPRMKAIDVLTMLARYDGLAKEDAKNKATTVLLQVGLTEEMGQQKVTTLSHGQRRRIGIAQTLLGSKEIICLDEPTSGLDPRAAAELRQLITSMRGERTVIISSHNLAEIESVCDHVAILNKGTLVSSGPMAQVRGEAQLVSIQVEKPMETPMSVASEVEQLEAVSSAHWTEDSLQLQISFAGGTDDDAIVNQVVSLIISKGGLLKGIDRGKSLEDKFLEKTAKTKR